MRSLEGQNGEEERQYEDDFRMEKVLGYKDGKVGAVFERHAYYDEKRRAFYGWSRELRRILNGAG